MNVIPYMTQVPDHAAFPTVDAMHADLDAAAAAHPDLVRVRRIGTSRLGEPLRALTIGDGAKDVVVIGGPHPNEPVGALTVAALIALLCRDSALRARLDRRWHLIPCADPDGARLNEGWYGRPGERRAYAEHFYRPDLVDQVEWTFPLEGEHYTFDRPLPETTALMALMDAVEPALVCSLHNGEHQGAFFYLNRDDLDLARRLAELPEHEGLPVHHGAPELPGSRLITPGVYSTPDGALVGAALGAGGNSADYAARFGALHLVTEVPYWADPRVSDRTPSGRTHREIAACAATERYELLTVLEAALAAVADDLTVRSTFRRSTEATVETVRRLTMAASSASQAREPESAAPQVNPDTIATVAEEFDSRQTVHLLRLRLLGVFLRMLDAELAAGNPTPAIREQHRALTDLFEVWFAEATAESPGSPIELRRLAAVQLGAILLAAAHA